MYVELQKKWIVKAERYVVVFSFDNADEAQKFIKPHIGTDRGPAFADLSGGGEVTVIHKPKGQF